MDKQKTCAQCCHFASGFCKKWKVAVPDLATAETCTRFSTTKTLNKGEQIRRNKLNKQARKRAEVKPAQVGLVCFVDFKEKIIERINGKYRPPTRIEYGRGLQVGNKVYLANGRYKMVNRSTLTITNRYMGIPGWATSQLVSAYNQCSTTRETPEVKKTYRKSCKTCVHFKFIETVYCCELTGKIAKDYNQKEHCQAPNYKRKPTSSNT